jgi:hypothetical protein
VDCDPIHLNIRISNLRHLNDMFMPKFHHVVCMLVRWRSSFHTVASYATPITIDRNITTDLPSKEIFYNSICQNVFHSSV